MFDVSHLGKGKRVRLSFRPLLCGLFHTQTGSSLLPVRGGPHIWAGERSERKGRDPLEKDHSFWDREEGFFPSWLGSALPGSQNPAEGEEQGPVSHSDVSHFAKSGNSVVMRSRACYGSCVSRPQQNSS